MRLLAEPLVDARTCADSNAALAPARAACSYRADGGELDSLRQFLKLAGYLHVLFHIRLHALNCSLALCLERFQVGRSLDENFVLFIVSVCTNCWRNSQRTEISAIHSGEATCNVRSKQHAAGLRLVNRVLSVANFARNHLRGASFESFELVEQAFLFPLFCHFSR